MVGGNYQLVMCEQFSVTVAQEVLGEWRVHALTETEVT